MSSTLRDFLLASGVKPRDISDAVRESRKLVRGLERWSGLAQRAAIAVAAKAKPGILQTGAFFAAGISTKVNEGAAGMLGRGRKEK